MDRHRLVCKAFQVQGYPHAVGGGTAKIAVQLHGASLIFRESSLGNGKETFSGVPSSVRTEMAPSSRSEEHTSELQSLMRISYAVFCLKNKKNQSRPSYSAHYAYKTQAQYITRHH